MVNTAWAALGVHAALAVFFLAIGAQTLAVFNVGSVALYFSLLPIVRQGWVTTALLLATAEVITHAALAVLFFGAQADFQYYIFALTLLSFLHDGWAVGAKIGHLTFICAAYLALSEWGFTHAPASPLGPDLLRVLRSFNIVTTFSFVAYLAHYHAALANRVQTELGRLATSDTLTGLYNRRGLLEHLEQELTKCERSGKPLSLLLADVDNFKRINDTFGHDYGDQALQAIANCLRATVRAQDLVARWGGEEFLLLMPDTPLEGAKSLAEKLRAAVSSATLVHNGQTLVITFTAAVMEFPPPGQFPPGTRARRRCPAGREARRKEPDHGGLRLSRPPPVHRVGSGRRIGRTILDNSVIEQNVSAALAEDLGTGDLTAQLIAAEAFARAQVISREAGILCGTAWFESCFRRLDPGTRVTWLVGDGDAMAPMQPLCAIEGRARAMLSAERPALNFLQCLSATATNTHRYVQAIQGTRARIYDTRKTLPGLRRAQKYAVRMGGGENQRIGLFDGVLIKENHILSAGGIAPALAAARRLAPAGTPIQIEVESLAELEDALKGGARLILLDNFELTALREAVDMTGQRALLEASGGITLDNVRAIAETGVDRISIGSLTKDVKAIDLSLRFV